MKKHLLGFAAIVAIAMTAAVSAVAAPGDELIAAPRAHDAPIAAYNFEPVAYAAPLLLASLTDTEVTAQALPAVQLRSAAQYAQRTLKRERPEVTPEWRRCPSV